MKKLVFLSMFLTISWCLKAQANDLCGNSQNLIVDGSCMRGTTNGAGVEDPTIDPALYPADVWYSFEAISNHSVIYIHPEMNADLDLYLFDARNGNVFAVGTAKNVAGELDSVFIESTPGTTYFISVLGWKDAPFGDFCIEVLSRQLDLYDPCINHVDLEVGAACYIDHLTSTINMKSYTFTATSRRSFISLDISGDYSWPAIAVSEDGCGGVIIHDWSDQSIQSDHHLLVEVATNIGQRYFFGVINTDFPLRDYYPMDYCVQVQNLAAIDEFATSEIELYPNPVSQVLNIQLGNKEGSIEIFDLTGRSVADATGNGLIQIDVQNFEKGYYNVVTSIDGIVSQKKILKQ